MSSISGATFNQLQTEVAKRFQNQEAEIEQLTTALEASKKAFAELFQSHRQSKATISDLNEKLAANVTKLADMEERDRSHAERVAGLQRQIQSLTQEKGKLEESLNVIRSALDSTSASSSTSATGKRSREETEPSRKKSRDFKAELAKLRQENPQTDEEKAEKLFQMGYCHFKLGNDGMAVTRFTDVLKLRVNTNHSYSALVYLGRLHAKVKNFDLAIQKYDDAIRLNYHKGDAFYHRAQAFFASGDVVNAKRAAIRALQADPKLPDMNEMIRSIPDPV